jgi:hypothetical protein
MGTLGIIFAVSIVVFDLAFRWLAITVSRGAGWRFLCGPAAEVPPFAFPRHFAAVGWDLATASFAALTAAVVTGGSMLHKFVEEAGREGLLVVGVVYIAWFLCYFMSAVVRWGAIEVTFGAGRRRFLWSVISIWLGTAMIVGTVRLATC